MKKKTIALLVTVPVAYILVAAFTFGYAFREGVEANRRWYPNVRPDLFVSSDAAFEAAFWPIYLPCHLSYKWWNPEPIER